MDSPKHSIIVPAYNTGEAIRRCIDSVMAQSLDCWELIVVDDGSTDTTAAIIDEYAANDERIRAIHIPNGGVSTARNVGIEHAKGEYVMFVDSDDWIEPDYLQQVESRRLDDADIYMVGITQDYTGKDGILYYSEIKGAPRHSNFSSGQLYDNIGYLIKTVNMESACLKSYRRTFLKKHGIRFTAGMIIFEDFHFVLSCLKQMPSVTLIPYIGYHYVVDIAYNPAARRGGRDLYPSIHNLFVALDELSGKLSRGSYSHEMLIRTIADKIQVVIGQASTATTLAKKKLPFKQISRDNVIMKHLPEVLRYAGGRYRLQHRCASVGFPLLAYLFYKLLRR